MTDTVMQRVRDLIDLTSRLTDLLARQANEFERRRPREAAAFVDEIAQLANAYRHESARVRRAPELIASAPAVLRDELVRATKAFDAVLSRHGRAVEAARIISEGLVQAIAEEIAVQRGARAVSYGPQGAAYAPASASQAIALNKTA